MRAMLVLLACLMVIAMTAAPAHAGETTQYVNGVEGLKAATLPPPGLYYRMYTALYPARTLADDHGHDAVLRDPDGAKIDEIDFSLDVFASVHRLIWVTDVEILGGNLAMDVVVPFINTTVEVGIDAVGVDDRDSTFGLGDIAVEPFVLAWHGKQYDLSAGIAAYVPTGEYDKDDPSSPGKDMWELMLTFGGTAYFDEEKTWSASILARYEVPFEKDELDLTPGDSFHFEWGIGKTLKTDGAVWDVGLAGYCHWQVTDDRGNDVTWEKNDHDSVHAIGPEVGVFLPGVKGLMISLRHLREFAATDRPEGSMTCLTVTLPF